MELITAGTWLEPEVLWLASYQLAVYIILSIPFPGKAISLHRPEKRKINFQFNNPSHKDGTCHKIFLDAAQGVMEALGSQ